MTIETWTLCADISVSEVRCRGLLIGRYQSEADAVQDFGRRIGLAPTSVAPGLKWSTTAEELISREAWNAITCEHHVSGREVFVCVRMDLPVLDQDP